MERTGRVLREIHGFFDVMTDDRTRYTCQVKKNCSPRGVKPCVGDRVSFEVFQSLEGRILHVFERTRELIRPRIVNADTCLIVCSLTQPTVQPYIVDKLLLHVWHAQLTPIFCLTKVDEWEQADPREASPPQMTTVDTFRSMYEPLGVATFVIDYRRPETLQPLQQTLVDRFSVLAGASGVGKSTLLNALAPQASAETDAVSVKTGRGRHATRHVQLYEMPLGGMIADSPGFSQLSLESWDVSDLQIGFPEFVMGACQFRDCTHVREPGCWVRSAVETGRMDRRRYEHYVAMVQEVREARRW